MYVIVVIPTKKVPFVGYIPFPESSDTSYSEANRAGGVNSQYNCGSKQFSEIVGSPVGTFLLKFSLSRHEDVPTFVLQFLVYSF